ncbi:hypothetical protein EWM64_g3877 [Hericium alpestre]|uniref:phosphoribosylaminoimidazole carboxylase n=1 Tax=Hericium alpestre TaxID=135208 RepID=A0A4Z0A1D2_9AGAM|nr:hypothetical protein EWM64_g3877 [Hericium alpestre]
MVSILACTSTAKPTATGPQDGPHHARHGIRRTAARAPVPAPERIRGGSSAEELTLYAPAPREGHSHAQPLVGIIMGSEPDLPVMLPAAHILDRFRIPYELTIVSTHRMPDRLVEYARAATARGL